MVIGSTSTIAASSFWESPGWGDVVEQHQELGVEADLHGESTLSSDKIS